MKYSKYNSIIPLTQTSSMLYSAVSDKFVIIKKEFEALLKSNSLDKIAENHIEFYTQLIDCGVLVEDNVNETEELIRIGNEINNDPTVFSLIINPTMNCNFNCWYCYETHHHGSKMSTSTISAVKKMITRIICTNDKIRELSIAFFGGEPLLYYQDTVKPIVDFLREKCNRNNIHHNINITSNGFLINNRVIEHLTEKDDSKSFQITLDGHREYHNKVRLSTSGSGSYDRILANIKKLLSYKIRVILRINYTIDNASSTKDILNDLKNIPSEYYDYLSVDFQKVWQEEHMYGENESILDESLSAFKEQFSRVNDRYNNVDTLRYPCYADKANEAIVNYNGDIFKCTARDFTSENRCGYLSDEGEIVWDDPEYMNKRQCSKFNKQTCMRCRIFPLCGGSCSQKAVEMSDKERCIRNFGELEKDKIILTRFYNTVVKHRQNESTPVQTT